MSQFREGSLGRLSSHEVGIPVYRRTIFTPDMRGGGGFGAGSGEGSTLRTAMACAQFPANPSPHLIHFPNRIYPCLMTRRALSGIIGAWLV